MEINYYQSESSIKPQEIEVGVTTVYFRRNFEQAQDAEGAAIWRYEEAALPKDKAILYLAEQSRSLSSAQSDLEAGMAVLLSGETEET